MDQCDDERYSRGPLLGGPPRRAVLDAGRASSRSATGASTGGEGEERPAEVREGRELQLMGPPGRERAVRVRGLDEAQRAAVRAEIRLLGILEVAGVSAVPAVLHLEEDGYVRETAPELAARGGRRAGADLSPPTGERLAVARAREALDALIDALHERGWVLGAVPGRGIGVRSDGSVIVTELGGTRPDTSVSARLEDRAWVDSVLRDQDRTLRRRLHSGAPDGALFGEAAEPASEEPGGDLCAPPTSEPGRELGRQVIGQSSAGRAARGPTGPGSAAAPAPLPEPRAPRRRRVRNRKDRTRSSGTAQTIRDVLAHPGSRRIALLSGGAVLLLLLAATAVWWSWRAVPEPGGDRGGTGEPPAATSPAAATRSAPAPEVTDPEPLAAELAGVRYAYITGMSEVAASAPGTQALAEDDRRRDAYAGLTVRGGGPVVHSAEILRDDGDDLVLRVETSNEDYEVEDADGRTTSVPADAPRVVDLTLRWDGTRWLILSTHPVEESASTS